MLSMRNPFPTMGKVIKYEFKHSSRIFIPLYASLIILCAIIGISKQPFSDYANISNISDLSVVQSFILVFGIILVSLLILAIIITTIIIFSIRFYRSMLGDEAYLTLTLPVTIGEHIWGRFIADFIWMIVYGVSSILSIGLLLCKDFANGSIQDFVSTAYEAILEELNFDFASFMSNYITVSICGSIFSLFAFILFIYFIISISHLFKDMRGFGVFITIVVCLLVNSIIKHYCIGNSFTNIFTLSQLSIDNPSEYLQTTIFMAWKQVIFNFVKCIFFTVSSYWVFKKHLNLE